MLFHLLLFRDGDVYFYTTVSARFTLTYCVAKRSIVLLSILLASIPYCIFVIVSYLLALPGSFYRQGAMPLLEKVFRYVFSCVSIKYLTAGCVTGF
jgi:hypothetical protein